MSAADTDGDNTDDVTLKYDALGRRIAKTAGTNAVVYVSMAKPIQYSPFASQVVAEYSECQGTMNMFSIQCPCGRSIDLLDHSEEVYATVRNADFVRFLELEFDAIVQSNRASEVTDCEQDGSAAFVRASELVGELVTCRCSRLFWRSPSSDYFRVFQEGDLHE